MLFHFKTLRYFIIFILGVLFSPNLYAQQNFKSFIEKQEVKSNLSFIERQKLFYQWQKNTSISSAKGHKQYARNAWYYQNRWLPNKQIPASEMYAKHAKDKQENAKSRSITAKWQPVGPFGMQPSPQPYEIRGVGRVNVVRFHPINADIFWIGTANGGIWKTENSGQSWLPLGDNLPVLRISDLAINPKNTDEMYVCLGDIYTAFVDVNLFYPNNYGEGIYKSVDGGKTWQPTALELSSTFEQFSLLSKIVIHPENPSHLIATGLTGVWRSEDSGDNWTRIIDDQLFLDLEIDPNNPNVLYTTSTISSSTVWKSTDFGQTWQALDLGIPQDNSVIRMEVAVAPSNSNALYVLAAANTGGLFAVYKSNNGGETWEMKTSAETGRNILAQLNGDPGLLDSEAFGQGEYDLALMVNPFDENLIYSGGINVWGSTDGGANWNTISFVQKWFGPSIHQDIHFINYNPLDQKYYVCNDGGIDRTDSLQIGDIDFALFNCFDFETLQPTPNCYELPTKWENISDGLAITEFYRIGLHPNQSSSFIAGSQDNSVFYKQAEDFQNIFDGDGMECIIHPLDPNILYAGMEQGRLELSYDGGQTIIDEATKTIFEDPSQLPAWVVPLTLNPQNPNSLYVGFSDIWNSRDYEQTWQKISNLPTVAPNEPGLPIRAFEIAAADSSRMYLSRQPYFIEDLILPGEFWASEDGGQTWSNRTVGLPTQIAINDIAIHPNNPDIIWLTCSHFEAAMKVFKSIDAGHSWQNISNNLPNFPVNTIVHAKDFKNTVFVGLDRGIWYQNDDSEEWLPFADELPNVIISELEIDIRTNTLYAATFGRGVWKTDLNALSVNTKETANNTLQTASISPNPGSGFIQIKLNAIQPKDNISIKIIDVMGRLVQTNDFAASKNINLDVSSLNKGLFYINIFNGEQAAVKKWVRQ